MFPLDAGRRRRYRGRLFVGEREMVNEETALMVRTPCDWSDISRLCSQLSALLDRFDRDRFAYLLRYGPG
jgi:hypothetical protein